MLHKGAILSEQDANLLKDYLSSAFGKTSYRRLEERIDRWALKVAPLNPEAYPNGNTKQFQRWDLPATPPPALNYLRGLYASEEECYAAKYRLMAQIVFMDDAPQSLFLDTLKENLREYDPELNLGTFCPITGSKLTIADIKAAIGQTGMEIGSAEINLDFIDETNNSRLSPANLCWFKPPYYLYALRKASDDTTVGTVTRMRKRKQRDGSTIEVPAEVQKRDVLREKIQRKAYLTDRKQTGEAASNRECRWEISPSFPQFATHQDCIQVEARLFAQVFEFMGAPHVRFEKDILEEIKFYTDSDVTPGEFRCPLSGQLIRYNKFIQDVTEAEHGESPYEVAHLVPLAYENGRHAANNISWITDLGNRVQGEDPIEKIVEEIFFMANYHRKRLNLNWQDVERRADTAEDIRLSD